MTFAPMETAATRAPTLCGTASSRFAGTRSCPRDAQAKSSLCVCVSDRTNECTPCQELKAQLAKYPDDFEKAYKESFVQVNAKMHEQVCFVELATLQLGVCASFFTQTGHPTSTWLNHALCTHPATSLPLQDFDDSMSGTTAITAFFKGTQFTGDA